MSFMVSFMRGPRSLPAGHVFCPWADGCAVIEDGNDRMIFAYARIPRQRFRAKTGRFVRNAVFTGIFWFLNS
jgi:hypothetical protein